ncbi:MAG: septal ring lytic transglycosylase RlpA family protein [Pseudohongiellaceae bacterium]
MLTALRITLPRLVFTLAPAVLLAGCATTPEPAITENAGRYSISQDRAPGIQVDVSSIPEVIPEPVERTLAGNRSPYTVLGKTYRVMATEEGYRENGVASWYGEKFHGHHTSNGEVFDMYKVSAAHKSLPIPSFLRVTNLENNRSLIVRVNDRGPFHGDRVIDLSYGAALKLGYADRGTARVMLEAVVVRESPVIVENTPVLPPATDEERQYLQIGAYADIKSAERITRVLREMTERPVFIKSVMVETNRELHRVRVGPLSDSAEIRQISERVVAANLGSPYTVAE